LIYVNVNKFVIEILQGSVVTQTTLDGPSTYIIPVAKYPTEYNYVPKTMKVIAMKIVCGFWATRYNVYVCPRCCRWRWSLEWC